MLTVIRLRVVDLVGEIILQLGNDIGVIGVERLDEKLLMAALLLQSRLLCLLLSLPVNHDFPVLGIMAPIDAKVIVLPNTVAQTCPGSLLGNFNKNIRVVLEDRSHEGSKPCATQSYISYDNIRARHPYQ